MGFEGTTGVVISADTYNRAANTVGALTVLPAKDIDAVSGFSLPNAQTVRVDGLAEIYQYMVKTGKFVMPDLQLVIRTDISAGAPLAASAYALLGYPEAAGAPTRTITVAIAAGMSISWEFHQDSVGIELPKDAVIMTTHNLKHANATAPVIVGF